MKTRIHQEKISDKHEESFWYDGILAETKHYIMRTCGEIDLRKTNSSFRCNGLNTWDEETTKDSDIIDPNKCNDEDLKEPYYFEANNWFEVHHKDNDNGGDVCDTYIEAFELLTNLEKNND